jgi:hypothetical protein
MATKLKPKKKTSKALAKARKVAAEIRRRNKVFTAASPAQKRVLIAKDVIKQIKAKRFIAAEGSWLHLVDKYGNNIAGPLVGEADRSTQIQAMFLSGDAPTCECCALGGIMMACTLYNNNQTVGDLAADLNIGRNVRCGTAFSNGLHRFFSRQQLALIECAFESGRGEFYVNFDSTTYSRSSLLQHVSRNTLNRALDYETAYPKTDKRMIAIMQNIVKNNGTFRP